MQRYAVVIPYTEPEGQHPDRVYKATIEVAARSPAQARVLATREFKSLTDLSWAKGARNIIEGNINVRSAEVRDAPLTLEMGTAGPGIVLLRIIGRLDGQTDGDFKAKTAEILASGTQRLIIDLQGLDYINSSSIGEMAALMGSLELRLACIQPGVLRILKMIGLDKAIPCFGSVELAAGSYT
jgi:anti-anti-sigma factor